MAEKPEKLTEEEAQRLLLQWGYGYCDKRLPVRLYREFFRLSDQPVLQDAGFGLMRQLAARGLLWEKRNIFRLTPAGQAAVLDFYGEEEFVSAEAESPVHRVCLFDPEEPEEVAQVVSGTLFHLAWAIPEYTNAPSIPAELSHFKGLRRYLGDKLKVKVRLDDGRIVEEVALVDVYLVKEIELTEDQQETLELVAHGRADHLVCLFDQLEIAGFLTSSVAGLKRELTSKARLALAAAQERARKEDE